jgi:hypothetical protein
MMLCPAPEVRDIAQALIGDVSEHAPLDDVRVEYVFRDKAPRSHGRLVLGRARKISGLAAWLAEAKHLNALAVPRPFFVIEISHDTWGQLTPVQRRALVDHELCHCRVEVDDDGEAQLSIRGHDFEEFASVIRRNGLWASASELIAAAVCEQLALAVDEVTEYVEHLRIDDVEGDDKGDDKP